MEKLETLLVTGRPGTGKTTVLLKTIHALESRGFSVGGMITREIRSSNARMGFEIVGIKGNRHGWLARIDLSAGPRIGKYRVNLEDLDSIGVKGILDSIGTCDIIAIDEIGPMELLSGNFRKAVREALTKAKIVIATIHWSLKTSYVEDLEASHLHRIQLYEITPANRESLPETIADKAESLLREDSHS